MSATFVKIIARKAKQPSHKQLTMQEIREAMGSGIQMNRRYRQRL